MKELDKKVFPDSSDVEPNEPGTIPIPHGPGAPLQIFAENINVDLDPSKFPYRGYWPENNSNQRYLIADKNDSMIWVWYYIGSVNSNYHVVTFRGEISGIPHVDTVVAGCCTEWDIDKKRPKMGIGTKCFVYGSQRDHEAIRVIGGHNNRDEIHLAIGFLAPIVK